MHFGDEELQSQKGKRSPSSSSREDMFIFGGVNRHFAGPDVQHCVSKMEDPWCELEVNDQY